MSQYIVLLDVNHRERTASMRITRENGERPSAKRQRYFSPDIAQRIATADGMFSLDTAEIYRADATADKWVKSVQREFLRSLVSRYDRLVFNGGLVYDARDSHVLSVQPRGNHTRFTFVVENVIGDYSGLAVDALLAAGRGRRNILSRDSRELIHDVVYLCYQNSGASLEELELYGEPDSIRIEAALEVIGELAPHYTKVTEVLSRAGAQLANEIEANGPDKAENDSRLDAVYEQVRDMRGAIEKLYQQVSDMVEGD